MILPTLVLPEQMLWLIWPFCKLRREKGFIAFVPVHLRRLSFLRPSETCGGDGRGAVVAVGGGGGDGGGARGVG
jgi:hypothetical protein